MVYTMGKKVFYLDREYTTSENLRAVKQIEIGPFKMVPITKTGNGD